MFIADKGKEGRFKINPQSATQVVKDLEPGLYTLEITSHPFFGTSVEAERTKRYDPNTIINTGVYKEVIDHIESFLSDEMYEIREEMGLMHKLGIILNGGFGTGNQNFV